jgi:hypothetical protein
MWRVTELVLAGLNFSKIPVVSRLLSKGLMNKNTLGPLVVVLVGVAAFGTILAFSEHPIACPCDGSSNPSNPWYRCLNNPCPMMVILTLDSHQFNSPTNLTLNISNNGAITVALIAYYVKDSSGAQYANSDWPGPTISPAVAISINILIDGTVFTFQRGNSYTVSIVTSRSNQFSFTVTD